MSLTVIQLLPALNVGGVERGTLEIAAALVAAGHRAIVISAGGKLVPELEASGAVHVQCPIGEKRLATLRTIKQIRATIIQHGADIVHARSRLPAWIGYRAIKPLPNHLKPRWVTTVHGPYTVNAYSRIMTSGDRVIAISEFIRAYILKNYPNVDPTSIEVIPRGVDETAYPYGYAPPLSWQRRWHKQHPQLSGKRLLVLPGRLTRWKGQEHFVELMAKLLRQHPDAHGLIAGGTGTSRSSFESDLRAKIQGLGIRDDVTFLGQRDDLREVLAHADIAYSLTLAPEAFGRTTIEALSLGTPVIGYDHGGTGEILNTVFPVGCVPINDIQAGVARTSQLLSRAVNVPAIQPYTLRRMQADTLRVYEELA